MCKVKTRDVRIICADYLVPNPSIYIKGLLYPYDNDTEATLHCLITRMCTIDTMWFSSWYIIVDSCISNNWLGKWVCEHCMRLKAHYRVGNPRLCHGKSSWFDESYNWANCISCDVSMQLYPLFTYVWNGSFCNTIFFSKFAEILCFKKVCTL